MCCSRLPACSSQLDTPSSIATPCMFYSRPTQSVSCCITAYLGLIGRHSCRLASSPRIFGLCTSGLRLSTVVAAICTQRLYDNTPFCVYQVARTLQIGRFVIAGYIAALLGVVRDCVIRLLGISVVPA